MPTFSTAFRTVALDRRSLFIAAKTLQLDIEFYPMPRMKSEPSVWNEIDHQARTAHGRIGVLAWSFCWGLKNGVMPGQRVAVC
jgi:hypothetical protein